MSQDYLIKYEGGLIRQVNNAISITNKLLTLTGPQLIPYRKGNKWGFCKPDKKIVIDCMYNEVSVFQEGIARIKNLNGVSIINGENKFIVPFIYDDIDFPFYNDATAIFKNGRIGLIDIRGNEILSPKEYDYIWWIPTDEFIRVEKNNKEGLLDWKNGREIIACIYNSTTTFCEGFAAVQLNDKWGFIDKAGEIAVPIKFESVSPFSDRKSVV